MQFNSFIFIMFFLPLTAFIYFLSNRWNEKSGKIVIVTASIVFYIYSDVSVAKILLISILLNSTFLYEMNRLKKKKRLLLFVPVLINIGLLIYFKYTNFAITNINLWFSQEYPLMDIVLPVGISFFTFQQIAYCVAVYDRKLSLNMLDYMAFILYFPKILMGPLMDPVDFSEQINNASLKRVNWENVSNGIKIFSFGLFKKLLLADTFAQAVAWGFENVDVATSFDLILVMLFYTFEIYFDFSGYSDMAVGASVILNIRLPINFDSPYKALSIRDFWKRWHISLTRFFTNYVYIPLGGNRRGIIFTCFNTLVVFSLSGIWHGANWTFILWGVLHGLFSIFDRLFDKVEKKVFEPVRWFCTFVVVNVLWLLFRAESVSQWIYILKQINVFSNTNISDGLINIFKLNEADFICSHINMLSRLADRMRGFWLILFTIAAFGLVLIPENNYKRLAKNSYLEMFAAAIVFVWGFICLGSESVFVYFGF